MTMRFLSVILGIAFVSLCAAQQPSAPPADKPTPHDEDGHPDLSGRWGGTGGFFAFKDQEGTHIYLRARQAPKSEDPDGKLSRYYLQVDGDKQRAANPDKPPYKPELLGKVHQLDRDENKLDPVVQCHPPGVPRMGPPARIVQSRGWIVFIYVTEPGNFERLIPTDGRAHRTDLDTSYNGDSVAHWEGNTLVVDDTGFNDEHLARQRRLVSFRIDARHRAFHSRRRCAALRSHRGEPRGLYRTVGPDSAHVAPEHKPEG